ncbi:hypothetical protein H696_05932 [Fonticula alba]|uniref:Sm domain-containing protein n=1 Tax=Fonticula alba TaxID=691883 RepID=A0A058Z067_FONAL|nr:hypothetical protein H696_05932 [Fonticula alba]KCV67645.1 hypothetical protein H696_05932 [Fonticula alba]|eukprot:XP_009497983.1 hypothetical protein H696_05932 [Fonticula alba]
MSGGPPRNQNQPARRGASANSGVSRGGRGGGRPAGGRTQHDDAKAANAAKGLRARRDPALDLATMLGKKIRVSFVGGREVVGVLRSYDPLMNLVLDETVEYLRNPSDSTQLLVDILDPESMATIATTRPLGLVVVRTSAIVSVSPDMLEAIDNPFESYEEIDEETAMAAIGAASGSPSADAMVDE